MWQKTAYVRWKLRLIQNGRAELLHARVRPRLHLMALLLSLSYRIRCICITIFVVRNNEWPGRLKN